MSYLAPTPSRPIPLGRLNHPYTPDKMSTSPMSRCSDSFISTPDYDHEHSVSSSWGMQSSMSSQDQFHPSCWSSIEMQYRLPCSSSENLAGALELASPTHQDEYYSLNFHHQHQQQHHHHQQQPQPPNYLTTSTIFTPSSFSIHEPSECSREQVDECFSKRSLQDSLTPVSRHAPGTPNSGLSPQNSASGSPHTSPAPYGSTVQNSKRARARKTPALSHSVVERRYREGLNSKIDLLHRVLEFADQHSATMGSSGSSNTSDDLNMPLDESCSTKGALKARKADVLTSAIDYVKRSEREKAALMHEIEFWKTRVASAAEYA